MACWLCRAIGALTLAAIPAAGQLPMRPYTVDHFARRDSAADVAFLLDAPAGKHGFIQSSGGHFVTGDGKRWRIWGVNLTGWVKGSTNLPPKDQSPLWAAELARLGVNCVRFHFLDKTTKSTPRGLIDGNRDDSRVFDKDQLDRLDFFISELKNRGIYSDLNLNVGRTYKPGDAVPDSNLIGVAKAMTYLGPRLHELQREYARLLLTHYNPYTRSKYSDEPAIAIVELVNENSVLEFWMRNWLRGELKPDAPRLQLDLTPYYEKILTDRYNDWLQKQGALPAARLRRDEFADASEQRFHNEAAFYTAIESDFFRDMTSYLRNDLGVKSLIAATADHTYFIPGLPLLRSTSKTDIVDAHVYWQHPAIWGRRNTPMVNDPLRSTVVKLTRSAFVGKPLTVSEVNHPFPNEYGSEMIPILAAYGAMQDWDAVFFYTFEPKLPGESQPFIADPFDISQDPVRMAQFPVGALLFRRGDVSAARQVIERTYSTKQVDESMRLPESAGPYYTPGFPLSIPLRHGSRVRCLDCAPTPAFSDDTVGPYVSDTGELAWSTSPEKGGIVTIATGRTQALVGFVKANGKSTPNLSADIRNDFCAITVSALDERPISRARRLLVTATSREENTGSTWNERHTLFDQWGGPPTLIEPVTGWVMLRNIEGAVGMDIHALDGAARPIGALIRGRRLELGWEFPVGDPVTTTYLIDVIR